MNTVKMLNRAISKGQNPIEAEELLNEVLATFEGCNLASALHYNGFISLGLATKMQSA